MMVVLGGEVGGGRESGVVRGMEAEARTVVEEEEAEEEAEKEEEDGEEGGDLMTRR